MPALPLPCPQMPAGKRLNGGISFNFSHLGFWLSAVWLVILRLIMADDATCRRSEETVTGIESKKPMIRAQRTRNARKGVPGSKRWL